MKPEKHIWVDVTERLPEIDEYYLVACNSYCPSGRHVAFLENFGHPNWVSDGGDIITEHVTHWQKLPKAPGKDNPHDLPY